VLDETGRLAELSRENVLAAIALLDEGTHSPFAESTKFDLVYRGRRYPPKRVAGHAYGSKGNPYGLSIQGVDESSCFRPERCGFPSGKDHVPAASANSARRFWLCRSISSTTRGDERRGELKRLSASHINDEGRRNSVFENDFNG